MKTEYTAEDRIAYLKSLKPKLGDREVYVHYKGGVYVALGMAENTETKEQEVIHMHLWPHNDTAWKARAYKSWIEQVELNGVKVPRFMLVDFDKL